MSPLDRIHWLNVGLMGASCGLAFWLPFEVFLLAYAVLGPLHYLTQISWLHQRGYFVEARVAYLPLALVCIAALSFLALTRHSFDLTLPVTLLAGIFLAALPAALLPSPRWRVAGMVLAFPAAFVLAQLAVFDVWFAIFLPTIVHVFVFTAGFIVLGALRSASASGFASLAVLILCSALVLTLDAAPGTGPGESTRGAFGSFLEIHVSLSELLGFGPYTQLSEVFTSPAGVKVQRFIAFAYLYHYLNWFSKTSVIQWHRIPKPWAVANGVLWAGSVALYTWDYRLGLSWLYALSLAHVVLEFPLDHRTFAEIGRRLAPERRAQSL